MSGALNGATRRLTLFVVGAILYSLQTHAATVKDMVLVDANTPYLIDIFEYPAQANAKPANISSLQEAIATCKAQGKRLPTLEEWKTAASDNGRNVHYTLVGDQVSQVVNIKGPESYGTTDFARLGIDAVGTVGMTGNRPEWAIGPNGEAYQCGGGYEHQDLSEVELSQICSADANKWPRKTKTATVRCVLTVNSQKPQKVYLSSTIKDSLKKIIDSRAQLEIITALNAEVLEGTQVSETENLTIEADTVAFVTHATNRWDYYATAKEGLLKFVAEIEEINKQASDDIPMLFLMHTTDPSGGYFWDDFSKHTILISQGGGHRVNLSQTERVLLSGGYFDQCLCRTVRDILIESIGREESQEIVFVEDAIYTYIHSTSTTIPHPSGSTAALSTLTANVSDSNYYRFVMDEYFDSSSGGICDDTYGVRDDFSVANLKARFDFTVVRGDKVVGRSDSPGKPKRTLRFVRLDELNQLFQ